MHRTIKTLTIITLALLTISACSTAPKSEAKKASLHEDVKAAIAIFKQTDPGIEEFFENSYGYAVFPSVGKGAVGVGGAYGRGEVYEEGELVGYCDLSQGTIGFQLGGQSYSEVIFFQTRSALRRFKTGNFAFAAQASAVALTEGAAANAAYENGVAVFTKPRGGAMFEASIGGQKFSYEPK